MRVKPEMDRRGDSSLCCRANAVAYVMNLDAVEKFHIPLQSPLLLIKTKKGGILACGYLSVETFNRTGEPGAIVRGVNTHDDMLKAKVVAVSEAARALGIDLGMTGEDALTKLS
ncbi:MAG: hypothetical protein JWM68_1791 [Verrucomicrobiales bacterium]|nr:hypothetical protein [Verrucomicrobiales bacterium]